MPETQVKSAEDALLDQLNGEMPPLVDAAPAPAEDRTTSLTVGRAVAPTPVQAAEAAHSTKAGGKGWKVSVIGEYFAASPTGKGKISKTYAVDFVLPHLYDGAALSVIKNKMLDDKLRKKHSDFMVVRTYRIDAAVPMSPETPLSNNIQFMNRDQLRAHIAHIRAPIDPATYAEDADLRDALIDYVQTPDGFAKREAERIKKRAVDAELAALNPDIEVEST